jgi:hypothetical protein
MDFLATHSPVFADATDPLEADNWLLTIEFKFELLHCTGYQKTIPGTTTQRLSWSLVGFLHRCPTY